MWWQHYPLCAEAGGEGEGSGGGGAAETAPAAGSPPPAADASPLHWAAALPDDLRSVPIVQEAKTLGDFVKSASHTKSFVGRSIQIPEGYDPANGPKEGVDLSPLFKKLGMPDTPGDYKVEYGTLPEGVTLQDNPAERQAFQAVSHKIGLAPWQVNALAQFDVQRQIANQNRQAGEAATAVAVGTAKLYELHGANTPNVQAHARHTYEIMGQGPFGPPDLTERIMDKFEKAGFFHDPDVVTGMANWAEQTRGSRFLGTSQPIAGASSAADVDRQLRDLNTKAYNGSLSRTEEAEIDRLYALKAQMQTA